MRRVALTVSFLVAPIIAISSYISIEDRAARKIAVQMRADEAKSISQTVHRYILGLPQTCSRIQTQRRRRLPAEAERSES